MATKKEIHENVMVLLAASTALFKTTEGFNELKGKLDEMLKPGKGGASVNPEDVYVPKAKDGKAYLQCSVSGLWMEATKENFYEDQSENNKFGGLKRLSRAAEAARKKAIATKKATEKAVMEDLLAQKIDAKKGNEIIAKVPEADFSKIEGSKEKPAV